jgi:hypothetical protein
MLPDRASVRMSREAGLMTLDLYPMSISNVDDLSLLSGSLGAFGTLVPQGRAAVSHRWLARPEPLGRQDKNIS